MTPEEIEKLIETLTKWHDWNAQMNNPPLSLHFDEAAEALQFLLSEVKRKDEALKPFAAIEPTSFCAGDGSEGEGYTVILAAEGRADFNGLDLARARQALGSPGNE